MRREDHVAAELEEFNSEELVTRYRAGLPLSRRQRQDAERIVAAQQKREK